MEHKREVSDGNTTNAIACHILSTNHTIKWDQATILETNVQHWVKRRVEKAIHIMCNQIFNLDCRIYLDPLWSALVQDCDD